MNKARTHNMGLAKAGMQWLVEQLCFYVTFVLGGWLVLLNARLRQAPKRWRTFKMTRVLTLLTFLILSISQKTNACDCAYEGYFLAVALKTELIALVKVTKYLSYKDIYGKQTPMSMEAEIAEILKGTEVRKTIKIWGDNGALCRPYLSQFDTGKYYVIAFYKGSNGSEGYVHKDEKATDYSISNCGDYWLVADMKSQYAMGIIEEKRNEMPLADLRKKLIAITFQGCDKCEIPKVKAVHDNLDSLNYKIIAEFLCTFDTSCKVNVEYSQFSNEILFKVLEYAPAVFFEVISKGQIDNNLLLKEIENPIHDLINLQVVYDKVKACSSPSDLKTEYLNAIIVAARKGGQEIKE